MGFSPGLPWYPGRDASFISEVVSDRYVIGRETVAGGFSMC